MIFRVSLLLFLFSLPAVAGITRIHSITPTFVKFTDGQVGFWIRYPGYLTEYFLIGQEVKVELNEKNEILSLTPTFRKIETPPGISSLNLEFNPTVFPTYSNATKVLGTFSNADIRDAQCYDRAHVWAYTAARNAFYMEKKWLFFADHFIERHKFKWWFHIAPVATVNMRGSIEERIMDRKFSEFPLKVKIWTDLFMVDKQRCKEVKNYTDYSEHPNEDDCYLISTTPFFWQPKDLEALDKKGTEKKNWVEWEVRHAFKHAFGIDINK